MLLGNLFFTAVLTDSSLNCQWGGGSGVDRVLAGQSQCTSMLYMLQVIPMHCAASGRTALSGKQHVQNVCDSTVMIDVFVWPLCPLSLSLFCFPA